MEFVTRYIARMACAVSAAGFLLLSSPMDAHAHKVNIFAYAEGGRVHTESYFADGGRAADCLVTVEDNSGKHLLEGTTDKDGMFSFDIPGPEDLRIVLHAGMGHKNDYVVKAAELGAAMTERQGPGSRGQGRVKGPVKEPEKAGSSPPPSAVEIRAIVDEAVEARLRPLYSMLADMKEKSERPRLTDVIGGIGYIVGIMGIIMYFKSKRA